MAFGNLRKWVVGFALLSTAVAMGKTPTYPLAPEWATKLYTPVATPEGGFSAVVQHYRLGNPKEYQAFLETVKVLIDWRAYQKATKKKELGVGKISKGQTKGLEKILELASASKAQPSHQVLWQMMQIAESVNFAYEHPIDDTVDFLEVPIRFLSEVTNYVAQQPGRKAANLSYDDQDSGLADPLASTFWKKPASISQAEAYYGFGRNRLPEFREPCEYDEPKTGFGIHGGFTVKCNGKDYKIKFGSETHGEPFNSRMVSILGFNAWPIDYVEGLKVKYDRKILTEYNERQSLSIKLTALFKLKLKEFKIQGDLDPFADAIAGAMVDGRWVASEDLKTMLLQDPNAPINKSNLRSEVESRIQYLVLRPGNLDPKLPKGMVNVGPWDWNHPDNYSRREVRGFGLLAAWLNTYDMRWDNNRLRLKETKNGSELLHYVSDLGSGLGRGSDFITYSNGKANEFKWTFTEPFYHQEGPLDERFILMRNYTTIQDNDAFNRMTLGDARWMARQIAQIRPEQISAALAAGGFSAAEIVLYTEKLISRRNQMLVDLGLAQEYPQLPVNRNLSFDPGAAAEMNLVLANETVVKVPTKKHRVVNGILLTQ